MNRDSKKTDWDKDYENWIAAKRQKDAAKAKEAFTPAKYDAYDKKSETREVPSPVKQNTETVHVREHREASVHPAQSHHAGKKKTNLVRLLIILIPVLIVAYLVYANFIAQQEFVTFYDIGSTGENVLTPVSRVSSAYTSGDNDYRNLTSGLVYFDVPIPRGADSVVVHTQFGNTFPQGGKISLGAKDQEVWHYTYKQLYNPALETLTQLPPLGHVYQINSALPFVGIDELQNQEGIVIATDIPMKPTPSVVSGYTNKETVIKTPLRGAHTFYVYAKGDLHLQVTKQDINWYEGADDLTIAVYDVNSTLLGNMTIEDDGVTGVKKGDAPRQVKELVLTNLPEGVYIIDFGNFDGLLREIRVNTNKIVTDKLFLAGNDVYGVPTQKSDIYFAPHRKGQLQLTTYHAAGLQNITYVENGQQKKFNVDEEDQSMYLNITNGTYHMTLPQNDIALNGPVYFGFNEENVFTPFKQQIIDVGNNYAWIQDNVDYLVTAYTPPLRDPNGMLQSTTTFNIKNDSLYVKDGKLSFVFNVPHLSQEEFMNYTIPIDWIEVHVTKPGAFT